MTRTHPSLAK